MYQGLTDYDNARKATFSPRGPLGQGLKLPDGHYHN